MHPEVEIQAKYLQPGFKIRHCGYYKEIKSISYNSYAISVTFTEGSTTTYFRETSIFLYSLPDTLFNDASEGPLFEEN
jgi:hypothetical protein